MNWQWRKPSSIKANAELALAKLHLSFTEIRAPFDGTIDRIPLKLGSLVDEGELLTSLSDNSQVLCLLQCIRAGIPRL